MDEVSGLAANYYEFGGAIGIRASELEKIKVDATLTADGKLRQVVLRCLKQNYNVERFGLPTWKNFVEAADRNDTALAKRIAAKHQGTSE